nr:GNAT family N-acetyltransferase [Aestuariivita boseongensis]
MSTRAHLSETEIAQIINDKDQDHVAIGALAEENGTFFLPVGLARFVRLSPGGRRAEAAVTVVDDFQGQGAGRLLIDALAAHARRNGIEVLTGIVHAENHAMLHLLRSYDGLREHLSYGEVEFEIPLSEMSGSGAETS